MTPYIENKILQHCTRNVRPDADATDISGILADHGWRQAGGLEGFRLMVDKDTDSDVVSIMYELIATGRIIVIVAPDGTSHGCGHHEVEDIIKASAP